MARGPIIPKNTYVKLVYFEEFQRIDEAFYREKQVQGWSRKKKEALINGCFDKLRHLRKNKLAFDRLRRHDKMTRCLSLSKTPLLTFLQPPLIRAIIAVVSSHKKNASNLFRFLALFY